GNCGKFLGPLGLALIMGAGDLIKPAAPNLVMLGPALSYFAAWYLLGVIGFCAFGFEPKGRTFDEIDSAHGASPHDSPAPACRPLKQARSASPRRSRRRARCCCRRSRPARRPAARHLDPRPSGDRPQGPRQLPEPRPAAVAHLLQTSNGRPLAEHSLPGCRRPSTIVGAGREKSQWLKSTANWQRSFLQTQLDHLG